jgi:hypothetical protein
MDSSQFLLQKGWIKLKGGINIFEKKRFAALCAPRSVQDIASLYHFIFGANPLDESCIPILGSIAFSAVQSNPFIIILDSEAKIDNPLFIHLDTLVNIKDEVELGSACGFALDLGSKELKFQVSTSIEYQDWVAALDLALKLVKSSKVATPLRRESLNPEGKLATATPLAPTLPRRVRPTVAGEGMPGSAAVNLVSPRPTLPAKD